MTLQQTLDMPGAYTTANHVNIMLRSNVWVP